MTANKTGYLTSDFRIFYLTNTEERDFQSHYHDFHKLLIFESGSLSYYIEGETYQLQPWDLVLVPAGEVHRPIIHDDSPYRRLILYLSPAFLERYKEHLPAFYHCFHHETADSAEHCFRSAEADQNAKAAGLQNHTHLLRIKNFQKSRLYPVFLELQRSAAEQTTFYQQIVLLQFLMLLSQFSQSSDAIYPSASGANQQILQALTYINEHLQEELSVDQIAASCFLNRSYLMHLFRRETGYSVMSYVTEKRLFAARTLIQSGVPVTEACLRSGFQSYSAFYRAYHKKFKEAPKAARS